MDERQKRLLSYSAIITTVILLGFGVFLIYPPFGLFLAVALVVFVFSYIFLDISID